jgi:hypothetical protein
MKMSIESIYKTEAVKCSVFICPPTQTYSCTVN